MATGPPTTARGMLLAQLLEAFRLAHARRYGELLQLLEDIGVTATATVDASGAPAPRPGVEPAQTNYVDLRPLLTNYPQPMALATPRPAVVNAGRVIIEDAFLRDMDTNYPQYFAGALVGNGDGRFYPRADRAVELVLTITGSRGTVLQELSYPEAEGAMVAMAETVEVTKERERAKK